MFQNDSQFPIVSTSFFLPWASPLETSACCGKLDILLLLLLLLYIYIYIVCVCMCVNLYMFKTNYVLAILMPVDHCDFFPHLFCAEHPPAASALSLRAPAPLVLPWGPPGHSVGAAWGLQTQGFVDIDGARSRVDVCLLVDMCFRLFFIIFCPDC